MKALALLFLALPMLADEPEGTEWYDAEGRLVLVEGPDAEPAEVPFVAEWRKREIERRERSNGRWSSDLRPVWNGGVGWGGYYRAYPLRRVDWRGLYHRPVCRGLFRPIRQRGVIIRW